MTEPTESQELTESQEPTESQEESQTDGDESDEAFGQPSEEPRPGTDEPLGEPEQPQGLSEKEIEARFDKLTKEKERHAKRVGEILEEDAQSLIVCELCWPPTPGFRLEQMPEEQRSAVLSAIGFQPEPELEDDKTARQCPDCKGYGKVKTGSKVSGYDAMVCQTCQGAGAVGERFTKHAAPPNWEAPIAATNGPQNEAPLSPDRDAARQAAQAAGFMVIDTRAPAPA